jgi:hypothetical protein
MRIIRIALLLMGVALVGPSAAGALASGGLANQPAFRSMAAAPADAFTVSGIEFALQRGDNATPINPSNRFAFGTRHVWAFWSWDDAKNGSRVNYVLRLGGTDVAWGTINADGRNGRMEVDLERLDGDYLGLGTYRLYLDASGGDSGNVRQAELEIYDPDHHDNNNGNSNNNNANNNNNNTNNNGNSNNNNNNANNNNGNTNNNNSNDNGNDNG